MAENFKMTVSDSILYVGVDDDDIELFENQYPMEKGVSYNSYVIMDAKIAIMDTVDKRKTDEWLKNLDTVLGDKTPDYLVVQHLEPDHSGSIGVIIDKYPEIKVVGSVKTGQMLPQFIDQDLGDRFMGMKEGDTLELGEHKLTFVMAPMVHWPEVMVSYESSEKVLFSADGFGTFGSMKNEVPWIKEATHYYFNIVGKFGNQVQALLKKAAGLEITKILPLHGPVLDDNLEYYIGKYDAWSRYQPEKEGVFIPYATCHGNTAAAVEKFAEELRAEGLDVRTQDINAEDLTEAVEQCFIYDRIVLASITYEGGLFPSMEDLLFHLVGKNVQNKKIGVIENGSWGPMAGKKMLEHLSKLKNCEIIEPVVTIKTRRTDKDQAAFEELKKALIA